MAYPAKAIANYFINKARDEKDPKLDSMKLLKLIYIAHGWSLAILDHSLINEPVEAWPYGPVISTVYQEIKYSGLRPIHEPIKGILLEDESFSNNVKNLLKIVWKKYKDYTGIDLSNWSHNEDGPWYSAVRNAKKEAGYLYNGVEIPEAEIKKYFKDLLKQDN